MTESQRNESMAHASVAASLAADKAALPEFAPLMVHDVPLGGRVLIEASAGTGKTFNITGLYARLILGAGIGPDEPAYNAANGLLPESILVVTFTKAATAELKDRIRLRLAQLTQTFVEQTPVMVGGAPEPFCAEVWERVLAEGLDPDPLLRQLRLALATLDCAAISTIHSFCQRLLTEQAFEAGFDFDRQLLEDESELLAEITHDFWRSQVYAADMAWVAYLREQKIDVPYLEQLGGQVKSLDPAYFLPLPDLPSATYRDERRAQYAEQWQQCQRWWDQDEIAALLLNAHAGGIFSGTYKLTNEKWQDGLAAVNRLLQSPTPSVSLCKDWEKFTQSHLLKMTKKEFKPVVPQHEFFIAAEALLANADSMAADLALQLKYWRLDFARYVREQLALRKAHSGKMSFDDSITCLAGALNDTVRAQNLANKVNQKYRAALVDEFQDTDPLQFKIIDRLFGHALSDGSAPPFFMVGDPKQAIYAFRGADVYAYLGARGQAKACYSIETNFRSDAPIVEFVNALFAPKDAFVERQISHPTIAAKQSGESKWQCADDRAAVHAFVFDGGNPDTAEKMLLAATADEIAGLLNAASQGKATLSGAALSPKDIAVLVPSHRQAHAMRHALAERGVAAVMQTRESVFASSEAQGLCAMLAAIEAPAQTSLLRKALVSSVMGFSVAQLMALQLDDAAWQDEVENLQSWRDEWRKFGFMPMFRRWLVEADIASRVLKQDGGERRLTNLLHVAELVQHESRSRPNPALLLAWLERQIAEPNQGAESQQMRLESDADRVRLVTIHASKGLEYPIVFCPFAWKGKGELVRNRQWVSFHQPSAAHALQIDVGTSELEAHLEQAEHEAYAEQIRLLYVAVTRAKHRLYLAYPAFEKLAWQSLAGLNNAPLTHLLRTESGQTISEHLKSLSLPLLSDAFKRLDARVTVSGLPEWTRFAGTDRALPHLQLAARSKRFDYAPWSLAAPWRLASFTSLTRSYASDAVAEAGTDYDADGVQVLRLDSEALSDEMRFRFMRGSRAGTTLHSVFEHTDFTRVDAGVLAQTVTQAMQKSGLALALDAAPQVADWLLAALAAPIELAAGVLRLNQLAQRQRLNEWQFLLGCKSVDIAAFCRVLAQPEFGVEPRFIAAAQRLKPERFVGYLNGFVDLVFFWQGQYFIADYKSNFLGDRLSDYDPAALRDVMSDSHYYLQYLLYSCAWHRHMLARLGEKYDYERDFGGVLYLFIRGMSPEIANCGVWHDKPPLKLIEALNRALGEGVAQ
ncbi:exodeoxyribonuclease V subunit beta [Deefgea piscis]|uniref:exodeoxyribonuclease V subunit beta n=1 Tax=Deefgea piscis TaxID=2739061 RepID=UPI001C8191C7|nr:exodeoxyribonuclease V subunit beta [Deefgea piscis]QZA79958.1 exodeoxyribonuclease V subunit beta [Deefgea piscis]